MRLIKLIICFFRKHEIDYIEELNIIAKGRCVRCDGLFCCNRKEGTLMRWDPSWDFEFRRMKSTRD